MRYCPGYGGILLRKRGYSLKVAVKRHVSRAPLADIKKFQRNIRRRIKRCQKGIPVLVQDESIFVSDARPGRVYTPHGIRAVCPVSGTHDKTIVYGVLGLDGEQLFLQCDKFNSDTLAEYIRGEEGVRAGPRDSGPRAAAQGRYSGRDAQGNDRHTPGVPSGGLAGAERRRVVLRQFKRDLLKVSYVTLGRLRQTIDEYFTGKTFSLDILKYLTRSL